MLSGQVDAFPPPVDGADLLLLVFHHLRRRGLFASAVSVLRESGVDPFWLCGPSRELALLREWVFSGEFARARSLLAPLRSQLPTGQWAALLGELGKLQVPERAFANAADADSGVDRRELLHQLLARARAGVETLDLPRSDCQSHEDLPFLRSCDAQECLDVIFASVAPSGAGCGRWSRFEARLRCFEALVRAFRDEIAPDEREHKYEAVAPAQLEWLVQDALLFHGQSDCITVKTRAGAAPAPSEHPDGGSDALYLSPPATESSGMAHGKTKERRGGDRQSSVARSVDCLLVAPPSPAASMAAVAPLPIPTRAVPDRERMRRKRHPLIASMDVKCMSSLREEEMVSARVLSGQDEVGATPSEQHKAVGVDAGTNTEPPTDDVALTSVEAATTAHVDVEEASTQTEAEEISEAVEETETPRRSALQHQHDVEPSKSPHHAWDTGRATPTPRLDPPPGAKRDDDGDGDSPHQGSDDGLDGEDVAVEDADEQVSADEGLNPHDADEDDGGDQPSPAPDDPPPSPLGYAQLAVEHIVRARVVAEGKEAHAVRAMDVHRSGRLLAIGTNARALRLLDLSTAVSACSGAKPAAFAHHLPLLPVVSEWHKLQRAPIYCVAFSRVTSSAPLVASGDADSSIKVLHLPPADQQAASYFDNYAGNRTAEDTGGGIVWLGRHAGKLRSLRFSPTESGLLWSAASGDRSIRCWDVSHSSAASSSLLALDGHVGEIQALALAPRALRACSARLWTGRCASGTPGRAAASACWRRGSLTRRSRSSSTLTARTWSPRVIRTAACRSGTCAAPPSPRPLGTNSIQSPATSAGRRPR